MGTVGANREAAGAAFRALRESREWSLADLAAATGVSVMGLSYLERGVRKPHKGTVQKVENGLGLPPGTYSRLAFSAKPDDELKQLLEMESGENRSTEQFVPLPVKRHGDADVLEAHAEAHLESLHSLIARLPPETSNEYKTYILSVIAQCVKAELLAANSWRVAVNAGAESAANLMTHLKELESIRTSLLARLPGTTGAQFDSACTRSGLPEAVIAALLGLTVDDIWEIRNRGTVPPDALLRVRAFVAGVQ
jgi:transcriptional regulator with XRE-family HTH domain